MSVQIGVHWEAVCWKESHWNALSTFPLFVPCLLVSANMLEKASSAQWCRREKADKPKWESDGADRDSRNLRLKATEVVDFQHSSAFKSRPEKNSSNSWRFRAQFKRKKKAKIKQADF